MMAPCGCEKHPIHVKLLNWCVKKHYLWLFDLLHGKTEYKKGKGF